MDNYSKAAEDYGKELILMKNNYILFNSNSVCSHC